MGPCRGDVKTDGNTPGVCQDVNRPSEFMDENQDTTHETTNTCPINFAWCHVGLFGEVVKRRPKEQVTSHAKKTGSPTLRTHEISHQLEPRIFSRESPFVSFGDPNPKKARFKAPSFLLATDGPTRRPNRPGWMISPGASSHG